MEAIFAAVIGIVVGGAACWLVQGFRARGRLAGMEDDFPQPSIVEKMARESRHADKAQPRLPEKSSNA